MLEKKNENGLVGLVLFRVSASHQNGLWENQAAVLWISHKELMSPEGRSARSGL